jgi:hypothetical protein
MAHTPDPEAPLPDQDAWLRERIAVLVRQGIWPHLSRQARVQALRRLLADAEALAAQEQEDTPHA